MESSADLLVNCCERLGVQLVASSAHYVSGVANGEVHRRASCRWTSVYTVWLPWRARRASL